MIRSSPSRLQRETETKTGNSIMITNWQIHLDLTLTTKSFSQPNQLMTIPLKPRNVLTTTITLFANTVRRKKLFNRPPRNHQHIPCKPTRFIRTLIPDRPRTKTTPSLTRRNRSAGESSAPWLSVHSAHRRCRTSKSQEYRRAPALLRQASEHRD